MLYTIIKKGFVDLESLCSGNISRGRIGFDARSFPTSFTSNDQRRGGRASYIQ